MRKALVVGPDRGLTSAFAAHDIESIRTEGIANGAWLDDAGIGNADLLVVTDVSQATVIPVAKDRNPDVRAVVYSPDTMPEFVRGQVDFAVDPGLLPPDVVAEELGGVEA